MTNTDNKQTFDLLFLCLLSFIFILPVTVAQEQQSLGTFEQGRCIVLKQTCSNCTYVNVTRITAQSTSNIKLQGQFAMTKSDTIYNRTFCNTSEPGFYVLDYKADPNGIITAGNYDFLVTPSGSDDNSIANIILYAVALIMSISFIIFGFSKEDPWLVMIGSMLGISIGIFILINGLGNYQNDLTRAISFVVIFTSGYIATRTGLEVINVI